MLHSSCASMASWRRSWSAWVFSSVRSTLSVCASFIRLSMRSPHSDWWLHIWRMRRRISKRKRYSSAPFVFFPFWYFASNPFASISRMSYFSFSSFQNSTLWRNSVISGRRRSTNFMSLTRRRQTVAIRICRSWLAPGSPRLRGRINVRLKMSNSASPPE